MNFKEELNFLRFLTVTNSVGLYDNEILALLVKEIKAAQIKGAINNFVRKFKHSTCPNEINLYVHIPHCVDKCNYCFCTHCPLLSKKEFLEHNTLLLKQIREFSSLFSGIEINSLCFGGGTPSLLDERSIQEIFESLFKHFSFERKIQINFEAHPSSLSLGKLKVLKDCGVNRLSLGVQSLDEEVINKTGRIQTNKMVYECIGNIRKLGFPYLNIDLITGLATQSIRSFIEGLKKIIQLKPEIIHLNPFSAFFSFSHYQIQRMDMEKFIKRRNTMILEAKKILEDSGYKRYGFEAYQLKKGGESYQEFSYFERAGSVLGLGARAKTNLAGEIVFENLPGKDGFLSFRFVGYPITKRYTMANFVIWHLLKGLKNEFFWQVFNEDVFKVFKEELFFLENAGLIKKTSDEFRYIGDKSMRRLFDYFSYTKIFYGEEILRPLRKAYASKYKPSEDYNSSKYFIRLFQDHLATVLHYDIGF